MKATKKELRLPATRGIGILAGQGRTDIPVCHSGQAGFTLVELLIAIAVSSIVLTSAIALFVYQQRVYSQQSDLAHDQAQLRGALQLMFRDLRLAGYTGIALGLDRQNADNATNQLFPLRPWPGPTLPDGTVLWNDPQYGATEGIEVWGNFTPNRGAAAVSGNYTTGTTGLIVRWPVVEGVAQHVLLDNYVRRIIMGNDSSVAYHEITALVDGATNAQITINPPLTVDVRDGDIVAPIIRRIYFVTSVARTEGAFTEQVGALIQRTYMVNPANSPLNFTQTCYVDEQLADRIRLMNLRYSLAVLNAGGTPTGQLDISLDTSGSETNAPSNPCRVRSVNVHVVGQTPPPLSGVGSMANRQGTGSPFTLDYSEDVNSRNVGISTLSCTYASMGLTPFAETKCPESAFNL